MKPSGTTETFGFRQRTRTTGSPVDLWWFSLTDWADRLDELCAVLSCTERSQFSRLRVPAARVRRMTARGLVRCVLGAYLDVAPYELNITTTLWGKPTCKLPSGHEPLQFSVSHSGDIGCVAVTDRARLGVDVERIGAKRQETHWMSWLSRQTELIIEDDRSVSGCKPLTASVTVWTQHEAYLKALGCGWADSVTVKPIVLSKSQDKTLSWGRETGSQRLWEFRTVAPPYDGFICSLVIETETANAPCCLTQRQLHLHPQTNLVSIHEG